MGRSLSIIKCCSAFLNNTINKAGPTGPSFYLLNNTINKAGPTGPSFCLLNNTINKAGPTGPSFYLLNSTVNKAGPTGSSFVSPGLLFSCVVRCHKEGPWTITIGSEQGSMAGP